MQRALRNTIESSTIVSVCRGGDGKKTIMTFTHLRLLDLSVFIHWKRCLDICFGMAAHPNFGVIQISLRFHLTGYNKHGFAKIIWAASSEFGTYRLCEQRRFRRACASAQSRQNLLYSLIKAVSQEEPSDRKPDPWPLWMSGHAQLKFVMTECSKTQIRLTRPIWWWPFFSLWRYSIRWPSARRCDRDSKRRLYNAVWCCTRDRKLYCQWKHANR